MLGPFGFPGLKMSTGNPPPPKYGRTLQPGGFALLGTAGSNTITISGDINQRVWPGSYPVKLYNATMPYPVVFGPHTIEGTSTHCKVDLVDDADLYDDAS